MPWGAETAVWCDARGIVLFEGRSLHRPTTPLEARIPESVLGTEPARRVAQAANAGAGGGQRGHLFKDWGVWGWAEDVDDVKTGRPRSAGLGLAPSMIVLGLPPTCHGTILG